MNANNEQIETIERYLNRQLSPAEVVVFENKIAQDNALAAEVAQHRLVHELIADRGLLDIKQKMQDSRYNHYFDRPKENNYLYGGLAIGLLLLSVTSYVWYTQPVEDKVISPTIVKAAEMQPETNSVEEIIKSTSKPTSATSPKTTVSKAKIPDVAKVELEETIQPEMDMKQKTIIQIPDNEPEETVSSARQQEIAPEVEPTKAVIIEEPKPEVSKEVIQKSQAKNIEYAFSPSLGQVWEFPIEENANCKMTILNKSGQIVYETSILNGFPNSWNGTSNRGMSITMGAYIYLLEYQNGQVGRGYVTVTQ